MSNQHLDSAKSDYVKGFIASLILTIIPFYFVATQSLPKDITYAILFGCAVIQVIVHFIYFLHMEIKTDEGKWNFVSLMFTVLVVLILIVGSIWIMWNLNVNMSM
ncbi:MULTISPECIES: cytochrome o ubiquinol oxidase subunit IV [Vibrio]|jgi:cytochrome o ubiquinol oxidase operon protein cyoD|uniref:Cytochrome bo(3) ubiquinol oxidase subunit 4 n=2 Tax=Vibrio TaxID=662 RepID=A0A2J8I7K6_VIBDI|nr:MULTISPECIES: cytochrome o ubiquinol oxidase subunit IV [Vibrio]MCZ4371649.1 cytochrome o ubiquinol oxidase subunit IV [Vibrio diazotrophicus]MDW6019575.1 cytochrome o ubiquinol oxidase subunit IV [Vibrio plantisponsor]NNM39096.1 cytochrome o ubiquinol oxidase subunit IV [Vibrio plantisponsor]PNH83099.1 cytochrome o ubiquinol oxidase subunit IV [Vibrio diazotrophicus]PNH91018.1 cytochrome o ubiquinol oxidase subunit IV [Vibrio diazotrophicus]